MSWITRNVCVLAVLFSWAGHLECVYSAAKAAPREIRVSLRSVALDQLKGWTYPKPALLPFKGKLPIKDSNGSDIKGRMGKGVIYYTSMFAGQRAFKVGDRWRVDTRYPDKSVGNYAYKIEAIKEGMGVRSDMAQRGRFKNSEFVLVDTNSNGRFDDAGKDVLVFDKKNQIKVGEQLKVGKETFDIKVTASGRTVTFGKAMAFAGAQEGGGSSDAAGALVAWNQIRASLGVLPVRRDPKIESWGFKHIEYMKAVGSLVHPEDKKHPKFTPEGHKAGMHSDLSAGQGSAKESLLSLMDTFFHRVALIRPEVEVVGISYDAGSRYAVVNYNSGAKRRGAKWPGPIAYPPDGATGVRPGWSGREGPSPIPVSPPKGGIGQTITLTFPRGQKPKGAKVTLTTSGKSIDGWLSTPEKPAAKMFRDNMNTLCFIAKERLAPDTVYKVKAEATVSGKAFVKEWTFTTGKNSRPSWGRRGRRKRKR